MGFKEFPRPLIPPNGGRLNENSLPEAGMKTRRIVLEDIKTFFKFVTIKFIILGKEVMHVK